MAMHKTFFVRTESREEKVKKMWKEESRQLKRRKVE